ncbi:Hsp70 family protein [Dactylosporangium sp. NPDC049140]|uniref:Hsp70 family protein n=1 Tax=Dactylosporangium sp. NPDC049140 TaxID=3155647 RepID=UPI00341017FE
MVSGVVRLGVDFGTSNTVAALQTPDGRIRPLLFDGSPLLASAVFAGPDADLLVGMDALRAAVGFPAGLEPNPKRRIDDGTMWLGEREYLVVDLIAAVLGRVSGEAVRVSGRAPDEVVLTHPATWGQSRLSLLADAAGRAGLGPVRLVPEPIAAAAYFATTLAHRIPANRVIVVYDLGAGTFDVSVVRPSLGGFEVVASEGLADVGGLDLDAVVVEHARAVTAGATNAWQRLDWPQTPGDQQARQTLWHAARAVKEQLSRHTTGNIQIPLVDQQVHLTREEFEKAARTYLEQTARLTLAVLRSAGIPPEQISGVFLVGGASRMPLAATLLHRALRIAPTVIDQPELVVADGALHYRATEAGSPAVDTVSATTTAPVAGLAEAAPAETVELQPSPAPLSATAQPDTTASHRSQPAVVAVALPDAAAPDVIASTTVASPPPVSAVAQDSIADHSAAPADVRSPASRLGRGSRRWLGALLLAVVLAVASLVYLNWPDAGGGSGSPARTPSNSAAATAAGSAAVPTIAMGTSIGTNGVDLPNGMGIAFSPVGSELAVATDGGVELWNPANPGQPVRDGIIQMKNAWGMTFSPDGQIMATIAGELTVQLWDVSHPATPRPITTIAHDQKGVLAVAFSPDGKTLALGGGPYSSAVELWNIADTAHVTKVGTVNHAKIGRVRFGRDGKTLITCSSNDKTFQLWDTTTAGTLSRLASTTVSALNDCAISPDGNTLATAGLDGTARIWDLSDPSNPKSGPTIRTHGDAVWSVTFGPGGRTVVLASWNAGAEFWDVSQAAEPKLLTSAPLRAGYPTEWIVLNVAGTILATFDSGHVATLYTIR